MLADGDKGALQNLEGDALGLMTGGESRLATVLDDIAGDTGTVARVVDDSGAASGSAFGLPRRRKSLRTPHRSNKSSQTGSPPTQVMRQGRYSISATAKAAH